MCSYKCLQILLNDNSLDLKHLLDYYISYISIFYCIDIEYDDVLINKVNDILDYINNKIKEALT